MKYLFCDLKPFVINQVYEIRERGKNQALVINMIKFKDTSHNRGGADKDNVLLQTLLPHFGFKVTLKEDLTKTVTLQ